MTDDQAGVTFSPSLDFPRTVRMHNAPACESTGA